MLLTHTGEPGAGRARSPVGKKDVTLKQNLHQSGADCGGTGLLGAPQLIPHSAHHGYTRMAC